MTSHEYLRSSRSIQEFWIDFLLEEEFNVSGPFVAGFLSACDPTLIDTETIDVAHSVGDKHGEADLIVRVWGRRGDSPRQRFGILIEDKITAGFQPRQAERYRLRGQDGVAQGQWDHFITVLVAPAAYLSKSLGFDINISFESLKIWIAQDDPRRREFKLRRLDEAIAKKNSNGVQVVDPEMTGFRASYYAHLQSFNALNGTDFRMRAPADTYWGDTWFILKSDHLPKGSHIRHMATPGIVEITFKDTDIENTGGLTKFLEADMKLLATGKYFQHVSIRVNTPKVLAFNNYDEHRDDLEAVFAAANRLLRLFQRNQSGFESILLTARDQPAPGAPLAAA